MKLPLTRAGRNQCLLIAILLLGFARGMMYANLLPPWGIIDEEQHLDYIKRVAEEHITPVVGKTLLSQDIIQSLFDVQRWDTFGWRTPASQSPKDMWIEIHSYEGYQPPFYYFILAPFYALMPGSVLFKLFFLRWVTVLLSLLTVWIAIRWTKDLFPSLAFLPYVVGLILVLIPERTMATSRINNDALLEVLGTAFLWLSTKSIVEGLTLSRSRWIAILLGLGVLTKISIAMLGVILLLMIWKNRRRADLFRSCLWMAGILIVLVLPFVIYNWVTYGDLTGISGFTHLLKAAGGIPAPPITAASFLKALRDTFANFWVIWWKQAGVGSNPALTGLYVLLAGLSVISAVGIVISLRSRQEDRAGWSKQIVGAYLGLIGIFVITVLVSYFGRNDPHNIPLPEIQGRFFLPVVAPIVILFSVGLYSYPRWRWYFVIAAGLILVTADGLNLFGNLLRQFYYWAWFYKDGIPISFTPPNLQQGMSLFFTRFWMDKPANIRPIICGVLPFYLITLAGTVIVFFRSVQLSKVTENPRAMGVDHLSKQTAGQRWSAKIKQFLRDPLLWISVSLFVLYILVVALRPPGIFWSLDEGGKFIYMQNVIRSGNPAAPLDYPGRAIDPQAHFIPLYWMVRVSDTEIYSWWPVGFPLVTIPFYMIFGWLGVFVLPAASGAGTTLLSGFITRRLLPAAKRLDLAAALLVGVATPVFYYSTMFWEHTLSTVFLLGSVYCLVIAYQGQASKYHWWVLAGGLASISAFFRTDALPLSFGIGLIVLLVRFRWAVAYGIGFVLTSFPWLVFNQLMMGDFFSRQMSSIDSQGWFIGFRTAGLKFIPYALFNAPLIQALPIGKNLLILGTLFTVVAVVAPFFKRFQGSVLVAYLGLLSITVWALFNPWGYRSVHGFLLIAPHVIFCVWFWVNGRFKKFSFIHLALLSGLFIYSIVYLSKMWVAGGGQQWGPRYQLALYPLLVITSLIGIASNWNTSGRTLRIGMAALFSLLAIVGLGFEIRGEIWAYKAAAYYNVSRKAIHSLPEKPITTNCTFLPMVIPEFYDQGNIFTRGGEDLHLWAKEVVSQGVDDFYDIDVDVCSYDHLDAVVENRVKNPTGMIIKRYTVQEFLK